MSQRWWAKYALVGLTTTLTVVVSCTNFESERDMRFRNGLYCEVEQLDLDGKVIVSHSLVEGCASQTIKGDSVFNYLRSMDKNCLTNEYRAKYKIDGGKFIETGREARERPGFTCDSVFSDWQSIGNVTYNLRTYSDSEYAVQPPDWERVGISWVKYAFLKAE